MSRYWITPELLVGESIADGKDWAALWAMGARSVINVECEHSDVGKGIERLFERGQPDDGKPRDVVAVREYVAFAKSVLEHGPIYVHCTGGSCRAPSAAYAILRGALRYTREEAMALVRGGQPEGRRCGGAVFGLGSQTEAYVAGIDAAFARGELP